MIDEKRVLALVPARSGSKGLIDKNIKLLAGKPLLCWPIEAARESKYVDSVVVSTDSPKYAEIAIQGGAEVPFLRPSALSSDTSSSIDFILHALAYLSERQGIDFDYLVLLEPTSPLTDSRDIDEALEMFVSRRHVADSIVGIAETVSDHPVFSVTLMDEDIVKPYINEDQPKAVRRQDLGKVYRLDGSFYISSVEALKKERGFYHQRTLGKVMPYYKSFEVDDIVDYICIEAIQKNISLFE